MAVLPEIAAPERKVTHSHLLMDIKRRRRLIPRRVMSVSKDREQDGGELIKGRWAR